MTFVYRKRFVIINNCQIFIDKFSFQCLFIFRIGRETSVKTLCNPLSGKFETLFIKCPNSIQLLAVKKRMKYINFNKWESNLQPSCLESDTIYHVFLILIITSLPETYIVYIQNIDFTCLQNYTKINLTFFFKYLHFICLLSIKNKLFSHLITEDSRK